MNEQHPHGGGWLREIVFGLNDGLVTTLVFLMVVSGGASSNLLLIMLSEVMAGGVSMALGGYLSARTEREILDHRIATEQYEIEHEPEEERAELREHRGCRPRAAAPGPGRPTRNRRYWPRPRPAAPAPGCRSVHR